MDSRRRDQRPMCDKEYWDEKYENDLHHEKAREWYREFANIEPLLKFSIFDDYSPEDHPRILHLGSGISTIPQDLAERHYTNQLCVDFSDVLVNEMTRRHAGVEGIEWKLMDVRKMDNIPSRSVDIAFDKGTLDAMLPNKFTTNSEHSPEDFDDIDHYIKEVTRVLKPNGRFIYITPNPPIMTKRLLNSPYTRWKEIREQTAKPEDDSINYYASVCILADTLDARSSTTV